MLKQKMCIALIFLLMVSLPGCALVRSSQRSESGPATEGTTETTTTESGEMASADAEDGPIQVDEAEDPLAGVNVDEMNRSQLVGKLQDLRDQLIKTRRSVKQAREDATDQRKQVWRLQDKIARLQEQMNGEGGASSMDSSDASGPETVEELEQQNEQLKEELSEVQSAQTRREGELVIVTLGERILFDLGKAQLKDRAKPTLNTIAGIIQRYPNRRVVVEGHADTQPIQTTQYPSNWHLSAARAVSVIKYLVAQSNMDPERFTAAGYGEYHPIAPNNTAANRQLNRRVEIVLYPPELPTKQAQR